MFCLTVLLLPEATLSLHHMVHSYLANNEDGYFFCKKKSTIADSKRETGAHGKGMKCENEVEKQKRSLKRQVYEKNCGRVRIECHYFLTIFQADWKKKKREVVNFPISPL